jgi:hypothetical protein
VVGLRGEVVLGGLKDGGYFFEGRSSILLEHFADELELVLIL